MPDVVIRTSISHKMADAVTRKTPTALIQLLDSSITGDNQFSIPSVRSFVFFFPSSELVVFLIAVPAPPNTGTFTRQPCRIHWIDLRIQDHVVDVPDQDRERRQNRLIEVHGGREIQDPLSGPNCITYVETKEENR